FRSHRWCPQIHHCYLLLLVWFRLSRIFWDSRHHRMTGPCRCKNVYVPLISKRLVKLPGTVRFSRWPETSNLVTILKKAPLRWLGRCLPRHKQMGAMTYTQTSSGLLATRRTTRPTASGVTL